MHTPTTTFSFSLIFILFCPSVVFSQAEINSDSLTEEQISNIIANKTVDCRGDGSMNIIIDLQEDIEIYNAFAGDCSLSPVKLAERSISLELDPFSCGFDQVKDVLSFKSYSSNITLGFDVSIFDQGQNLVIDAFKIDVSCTFEDVYTVDTQGAGYTDRHGGFNLSSIGEVQGAPIEFDIVLYESESYRNLRKIKKIKLVKI